MLVAVVVVGVVLAQAMLVLVALVLAAMAALVAEVARLAMETLVAVAEERVAALLVLVELEVQEL